MTQDVLVSVDQVSRFYGPLCAVNAVSFEVRRGEVLGFLGPNGAGKTTTMQMITGNLAPSAGQIRIHGIDILDEPKRAKAEIGFLPEQPPLYRELTVDEYLTYCARLNKVAKNKIASALDNAKQRCGLTQVGQRLIGNLSKGYQQRVGIAQAIIHSPAVVILDEPTVGLDPIQIREIRALIRELGGTHSVILSTHILPEVQATCDRVQIINNGSLVMSDTIDGLTQRMLGSSLQMVTSKPVELSALMQISGVQSVEPLTEHRYRVHHARDINPAAAIVEKSVQMTWGLQEIAPERLSLEEVFVNITRTEAPVDTTAEAPSA